MKKITFILILFSLLCNTAFTQPKAMLPAADFSINDIEYWTGEGENRAALIIEWHDGKTPASLVWGYKWSGDAYGSDMIKAILKADPRLFALTSSDNGLTIGGLGFDSNSRNEICLIINNDETYPKYPVNGIISSSKTNFDKTRYDDPDDRWAAGSNNACWGYWTKDSETATFSLSSTGVYDRKLQNGSWDGWSFSTDPENPASAPLSGNFTAVPEYIKETVDYTDGIFFVNEDWYGWDHGSINFLKSDGDFVYRVFRRENPDRMLGVTTQFGTIHEGNFYLVSKQADDVKPEVEGGRLIVVDATTLKYKAGFINIGGGDGRAFVGIDEKKGYISANNGVFIFDIENMAMGGQIPGTGGGSLYKGQMGMMVKAGNYVFAAKQGLGIYVIDIHTDAIIKTISEKNISTLTQSKDGFVWAAAENNLVKIDPETFETTTIAAPVKFADIWGAWNAGSLCASAKNNILYYANQGNMAFGGQTIIKYDIDRNEFDPTFFSLPGQTDENGDPLKYKEIFYGCAVRVDPKTDNLVITATESGYLEHYLQNRVHFVDGVSGKLPETKKLPNYYWFPAMPVFPPEKQGTGVTHPNKESSIGIYPNPAVNFIRVSCQAESKVTVLDVQGRIMFETIVRSSESDIDISGLSKGIYIVKINDLVTKFIKK